MIDPTAQLPVTRQAKLLALSRSSVYYRPEPVPASDLALMRRIDELHLDHPYAGSRMLRDFLQREGHADTAAGTSAPRCAGSASRRPIGARTRAGGTRRTGSIRTCCEASQSSARTMSGRWTSRTCR